MIPSLWPHQQAALNAVLLALRAGRGAGLVVLPTGCVAGDTKIGLNRGGKGYTRTIARAFEAQFHPYCDPAVPARIRSLLANHTGLNGLLGISFSGHCRTWQLVLVDGRSLRATPDHQVLTEHGWAPLGDLRTTDRVICECRRPVGQGRGRQKKPRYRLVQGLHFHPYAQGTTARTRRDRNPEGRLYRVAYHRLQAEAQLNQLPITTFIALCRHDETAARQLHFLDPQQWAVHHRDGNAQNNQPNNLAVLSHGEHHAHHGRQDGYLHFGTGIIQSVAVASVEEYGDEPVYDASCPPPHHNFVANGIVVHNCGKTGLVLSLGRALHVPMLFLVHREELLDQTLRAAERFWPEALAAAITAGCQAWDERHLDGRRPRLVVAMVPSLVNRLETIDPERFGVVVVDEAHLSAAPTWRHVIDHFTPGLLLGVTATPERHDGQPLDRFGREPLYSYSLFQAIKDGRLAPIRPLAVRTAATLDGVAAAQGDLREGQLARAVNTPARNCLVVEAWLAHGRPRRTIAFAVDRPHVQDLTRAFDAAGVRAHAITGAHKPAMRRQLLADFAQGELDVLVNCEVLTTGFDDPGVSCLLMCRPTASRTLYVQMVGRGLRLHPDKDCCVVIDFVDLTKRHKLVSVSDLLGRRPEQEGERGPKRPAAEQAERPAPTWAQAAGPVSWRLETVCPWPELPSLEGYVPTWGWQKEPASEAQLHLLGRFGLAAQPGLTKGEASYLIDRAAEYEAAFPAPATPKQRYRLLQHGLWQEGMGKRQASQLIGQLKAAERRDHAQA